MAFTPGKGTTFTWGSTAVGQVVTIKSQNPTVGTVQTTHITDTSRTYLATILEPGELTVVLNYDASTATHAQFTTDMFAFTTRTGTITFADANTATWASTLIVVGFDPSQANVDGVVTAEVKFKASGAITITP